MGVYWLPFTTEEQLRVIQALLKISFIGNDEKSELERIGNNLKWNRFLADNETKYLQSMIDKYGYAIQT